MVLTLSRLRWALPASASVALLAVPLPALAACPGGGDRADWGVRYRFTAGDFVDGPGVPRWVHFLTEPIVVEVAPDGPSAGRLEPGDTIVRVDGHLVTTHDGSRRFFFPGAGATSLGVRRRGASVDVRVVPGTECVDLSLTERSAAPSVPPTRAWLGLRLQCAGCGLDPRTHRWRFRGPVSVASIARPGPAADAGVRPGDGLVEIDGLALTSPEGAARLAAAAPGDRVVLTLRREGRLRKVSVVVAEPP